jgi:predicted DsbA family dithiol-disulfide isomerase
MTRTIQVDVVSDVACPWCAVGFGALTQAIQEIGDQAKFEVHFKISNIDYLIYESVVFYLYIGR